MQLDGSTVNVGDLIFDILLQSPGQVTSVGISSYVVDFGNGRLITYTQNGALAGAKRAYWRNPIILVPRKSEPRWADIGAIAITIRDMP